MFQPDGQIFGSRGGIVREKEEGHSLGEQRFDKLRCTGNQVILAINHSVHVDQKTSSHILSAEAWDALPCELLQAAPLPNGNTLITKHLEKIGWQCLRTLRKSDRSKITQPPVASAQFQ